MCGPSDTASAAAWQWQGKKIPVKSGQHHPHSSASLPRTSPPRRGTGMALAGPPAGLALERDSFFGRLAAPLPPSGLASLLYTCAATACFGSLCPRACFLPLPRPAAFYRGDWREPCGWGRASSRAKGGSTSSAALQLVWPLPPSLFPPRRFSFFRAAPAPASTSHGFSR